MNAPMKPYVLKEGSNHWITDPVSGEVHLAEGGTIVELTDAGFEALSDRFDPVDVVEARAEHAAETAAAAVEAAGGPQEPPIEVSEYKAAELIRLIKKLDNAETVRAIAAAEAAGGDRGSVIKAARARFDELTG